MKNKKLNNGWKAISILTIFILLVVIFSHNIFAQPIQSQKMTLLAVSEGSANKSFGSTATVTLELLNGGSGNVYINTFPFARTDTVVSVRLAKEVACDYLATVDSFIDCNSFDFIYSIETGSSSISGPSAGAALSVLTAASLLGDHVSRSVAISGTINSGGIISAVGGLQEKIDAAAGLGIKTVLIPLGQRLVANKSDDAAVISITSHVDNSSTGSTGTATTNNSNNISDDESKTILEDLIAPKIDLIQYGRTKGVNVWEVGTLSEAIARITGRAEPVLNVTVVAPDYYSNLMHKVSDELCGQARAMLDNLSVNVSYGEAKLHLTNETIFTANKTILLDHSNIDLVDTLSSAKDLLNTSIGVAAQGSYYAAASYCYGAALNLRFLSLLNLNTTQVRELAQSTLESDEVNLSSYQTLTDLQTYMLVDERLTEARERISEGDNLSAQNLSVLAINSYATAIERAYSAKLWSTFFQTQQNSDKNQITLDPNAVDESCLLKIQEATERQNLLSVYAGDQDIGSDLLKQAQDQLGKNPVLCLFAASKAKASYDVVLSTVGLDADVFNQTFQTKVKIAAQVIDSEFKKGVFPLIGYSYYEYALSLSSSDQAAAMLYIQYALELSNLDAYLSSQHSAQINSNSQPTGQRAVEVVDKTLTRIDILVIGLCLGILLGITLTKVEQYILRKNKSQIHTINNIKKRSKK